MKLVSSAQMASIDRRSIEERGIPGIRLMERAGRAVYREVREVLGGVLGRRVAVVCGPGNNGGDGFVVARLLRADGAFVRIYLLAERGRVRGDALANMERAEGAGLEVSEVLDGGGLEAMAAWVEGCDLIVDAIFGTGLRGTVTGVPAGAIDIMNGSPAPVVSIDIPSGVEGDSGRALGSSVQAEVTVAFGLPKIGHFFFPGRALRGRLVLADIGLPEDAVDAEPCSLFLTTVDEASRLLPRRPPDAHKGDCGRVLIISGSVGFTGAAAMTAQGALRAGAGLVTVGIPKSLNDVLEVKLTEPMTLPLPEVRKRRCLSLRALGGILPFEEKVDIVAIGPGISTYRETVELVGRILVKGKRPMVLDADALNALSKDISPLRECGREAVITPHPGEFSRLTGAPVDEVLADPVGAARGLASDIGKVVVLKGAPTVIASPSGEVYVNPTGNAGMATGGSGDVLTGIIAALWGQGLSALDAARCGVFVHGLAGDLAKRSKGELGMSAGDIIDFLPEAIEAVRNGSGSHFGIPEGGC